MKEEPTTEQKREYLCLPLNEGQEVTHLVWGCK